MNKINNMKKTITIAVVAMIMAACGESEAEKQKRLSDELNKNIQALQNKLTADTNELNRQIKLEKAKQ